MKNPLIVLSSVITFVFISCEKQPMEIPASELSLAGTYWVGTSVFYGDNKFPIQNETYELVFTPTTAIFILTHSDRTVFTLKTFISIVNAVLTDS